MLCIHKKLAQLTCITQPLFLQYCLGTVAPTLKLTISRDGGPFIAGLSYNLTCTVTLENAIETPTVGWLDPNNNPLDTNSNITVWNIVRVNCSTYTTTLHFTTLHTSHGGQYSCQATLRGVNNTAAVNITVPSKRIHFHFMYHTHLNLRPPFLLIRFSYKYGGAYN